MSAHDLILIAHVAAGSAGLVLGPVAMLAAKRPGTHTRAGELYHWAVLAVFATAVGLAALNWDEVWWLSLVGAGSYAFALVGYLAAKRRRPGWLGPHIAGQGGSYIAIVTATLIVNWQNLTGSEGIASPIAWILPTAIGSPLIAYVTTQVALGRRPRRANVPASARP
jgi:hypothetical protein